MESLTPEIGNGQTESLTPKKKMRMAVYARVSTFDQTTQNQIIRLKEFAERREWDYEIFEETMTSRKTRPVKQELLSRLRRKEFDGLLIYKMDRWARSLQELIMEFQELHDKGISIVSYSENIDLTTASGKLQFRMLGAFAEFERDIISDRTREGLHRARLEGKRIGRPKGSKDRNGRKKSGYYLRYAGKKSKKKPRNTYQCPKCGVRHSKTSKKGIKHYRHFEKAQSEPKIEDKNGNNTN